VRSTRRIQHKQDRLLVGEQTHWKEQLAISDEEQKKMRYSERWLGFSGSYEFDLTFDALGVRGTRKEKADYTFTPKWEYFDLKKRALHVGWPGLSLSISVLPVPQPEDDDQSPTWVDQDINENGVMAEEFWDALHDAIEERCNAEDAARRLSAEQVKGSA